MGRFNYIDGFRFRAAVRVEARDRQRLEQLCRYIARPALSLERVQINTAGQVEIKPRTRVGGSGGAAFCG